MPDQPLTILFHARRNGVAIHRLLRGIIAYARDNASWNIHCTQHTWSSRRMQSLMRRLRPDGVIAAYALPPLPGALPVVHALASPADPRNQVLCVLNDQAVGEMGARHLLETQSTNLAFVGYANSVFSRQRETGFLRLLKQQGKIPDLFHADSSDKRPPCFESRALHSPLALWLKTLPTPCAIMAANDGLAHDIAHLVQKLGYSIPRDFALLGVDDSPVQCLTVSPALSSISPPFVETGWQAARLLDQWIKGDKPAPGLRNLLPVEVITRASTEINRIDDMLVRQVLEYLQQTRDQPPGVLELARWAGVSQRTLELRFQQELGRTPLMEIRRQRIQRARQLLGETNLSVTEIAQRCGFHSLLRLSVVFRELTALSPTEYRRHRQGNHL